MNIAVCCICPDAKQHAHLRLVRPSWEVYAKRYSLPIHIVSNPPVPEHFYWGKYFLLELPELRKYDAALVLDNDILINPHAPDLSSIWNPERVGMVDERQQFGWDVNYVRQYYADYELSIDSIGANALILNGGVLIYQRGHIELFRQIYQSWLSWRSHSPKSGNWKTTFKFANDQPHVGRALQIAGTAQAFDQKFNRLWWSWWINEARRAVLPFKVYAKATKVLTRVLPRAWSADLAAPGLRLIDQAQSDCHFLHFAGSKSPLHLLSHQRD